MSDHYRLIAFDLDDTLAPSKSPLPGRMSAVLGRLLSMCDVCIISGGHVDQFRAQVLNHLDATPSQLEHLHLMPTCGTRYLRYRDGDWYSVYEHDMREEDRSAAIASLRKHARELGLWEDDPWGEIIEDRGTQITFSALGQEAPIEAKRAWDPSGEKRAALRDAVAADLPELEVNSGGSTSVDVTYAGVDKAFGLERLSEHTGVNLDDMIFVGDSLQEGGNDYPVTKLGCAVYEVAGWEDTADFVERICDQFQPPSRA